MSMRGEFLEWSKVYGGEGNEELAFSAGWDAAQKLAVASNSSHNKQSTPCCVPHCHNEGTVHLCEVHWGDLPQ